MNDSPNHVQERIEILYYGLGSYFKSAFIFIFSVFRCHFWYTLKAKSVKIMHNILFNINVLQVFF